jgi:hypothetical protein
MKTKFFVFTTSVLILSGCTVTPLPPLQLSKPSAEEQLIFKEIITSSLIDPESAKFKDPMVIVNNRAACIEINSKNSLGGYTGFQSFELAKFNDRGWILYGKENSMENCVESARGTVRALNNARR